MYLPALTANPLAEVVATCGRNQDRADAFASEWQIPLATTDLDQLLDLDGLDAVVVATSNDSHHEITMQALERGLHVVCEKPLGLTLAEAQEMADTARAKGAITLVPFTYRYMPTFQWVKRLLDDGFIGQPFHLNMRYFTGFAKEPGYNWRFDTERAGSGVLGDLGSHWLHVARWLFGEVTEIGAISRRFVPRPDRPDGSSYERAEDSTVMTVSFENGAYGTLQTSAVCWEGTAFNQTHHLDAHGADGTLYSFNDWETVQQVTGVRDGEPGPAKELPIPDEVWGSARRDRVHNTYKDVFRHAGAMTGDFIRGVANGQTVEPDFDEGARVQQLLELAVESAALDGRLLPAPPLR